MGKREREPGGLQCLKNSVFPFVFLPTRHSPPNNLLHFFDNTLLVIFLLKLHHKFWQEISGITFLEININRARRSALSSSSLLSHSEPYVVCPCMRYHYHMWASHQFVSSVPLLLLTFLFDRSQSTAMLPLLLSSTARDYCSFELADCTVLSSPNCTRLSAHSILSILLKQELAFIPSFSLPVNCATFRLTLFLLPVT